MDIKQNKNTLNIKFNTTKYNSKIEYNIALIDENDNIKPKTIHKKFFENDLICKITIYSTGIEPIETNFSLTEFNYDKNYTVIAYGKEIIRDSFNYFYLEPKTLLIFNPDHESKSSDTYNIINESYLTDINEVSDNTNIGEDSDNTDINEYSDNINANNTNTKEKAKNKISSSVIVIIVLASILIIGGIIIGVIFYYKKRVNKLLKLTIKQLIID